MKWVRGRQQSGYDKLKIVSTHFPFSFDIYILKFPVGSFIDPHVDKVKSGYKHYRLNIVVRPSKAGGDFVVSNAIVNTKYVKFFRPDVNTHSVTTVHGSSRWVLSIGWLRKTNVSL